MKLRSKILLIGLSLVTVCSSVYINHVSAQNDENIDDSSTIYNQMVVLDENGIPSIVEYDDVPQVAIYSDVVEEYDVVVDDEIIATTDTYQEANKIYSASMYSRSAYEDDVYEIKQGEKVVRTNQPSIVRLTRNPNETINYKEVLTGRKGYTNGAYANDAAYIQTNSNGTIRCKAAGVVMDIDPKNVLKIEPFTSTSKVSYYSINNGRIMHNYTYIYGSQITHASTMVGYQQDYMKNNAKYYSYDGHYFYTDYATMVSDYQKNTYANSINYNQPYYNYFQFLSHRVKSNLSVDYINDYIVKVTDPLPAVGEYVSGKNSKLRNNASAFVNAQNKYTVNAGLTLGISINESGYGRSSLAYNRNNMFGHAAYDSNPAAGNSYNTVEDCINAHNYYFISKGWLDGGDSRYRGPHLGDKQSGINVAYASDPYWGEKAAASYYYIDANKVDYGKTKIGIINGEHGFYKDPSTSHRIYTSGAVGSGNAGKIYDFPVAVIDTVIGSDGKKWYKIYSDTVLNSDRTKKNYPGIYDINRDYVYIQADVVTIVNEGTSSDSGNAGNYKTGDVNNDGKVDSMDMYQITQHILGKIKFEGNSFTAADTNSDNKIDSMDMYNVIQIILKK